MIEAGRILGCFSALLLIAALVAWLKLRGPALARLDGQIAANTAPTEIVAKLIMSASVIAAVAAILAIVGWIVE